MTHKNQELGELAEWLRSGLQIRVYEFDSHTRLQYFQWVSKLTAHWVAPLVSDSRSGLVLFTAVSPMLDARA